MATCNSPRSRASAVQLSARLRNCWDHDINWQLIPQTLMERCVQAGKAISMPASAVLFGLLTIVSYSMCHSVVEVEDTDWIEPVLLWVCICMPTGSGKTSLCKYLRGLVEETRKNVFAGTETPAWFADDQSFEKMGALMHENHSKLLGLYDELSMFLSQINVFRGKGITESHELAVFLQLYGGNAWTRKTVSGDANFEMQKTGLILGGFIQPSVARNIVEQPSNTEKDLCQRFLWCVPKPTPVLFDELEKVNKTFSASIVGLMSSLWRDNSEGRVWKIARPCDIFKQKHDEIQDYLRRISCMDDHLSGMLSKSKGQILRIAAVLHVLFHIDTPLDIPADISEDALKAAINIIDVCIQHAAFLAGKKGIEEMISEMEKESIQAVPNNDTEAHKNAVMCLLLPGAVLHLNALLVTRKFRNSGNKAGAIRGFQLLEKNGLGTIKTKKLQRGANMLYEFQKKAIPDKPEEKAVLVESLMKFGISIVQYETAYSQDDITISTIESRKRPLQSAEDPPPHSSAKKELSPEQDQLSN